uniref:Olfactory receptor n=1 Tax=Xenopus tropicalis TaxID=8364 RepID=F7AE52_XENTR
MEEGNATQVEIFILLGFSHVPQLRLFLIPTFTLMYACTILGNSLIILLIREDHRLHTPMYFFLANLSTMDLLFTAVTVPKMIGDLISREGMISFRSCIAQLFLIIATGASESPLLSIMAVDRYVAICDPLHYKTIMSYKLCFRLASLSWVLGSLYSLINTIPTTKIYFCGPNEINHLFCDIIPLLQLACSDIALNVAFVYISFFFNGICNFFVILSSYVTIITAIMRIKSQEGRRKAFSTCASHLLVVIVYYTTLTGTYLQPMSSYSGSKDKTAAVIYTVVTPVLNPIIYSLRNNDVKKAVKYFFVKGV